MTKGFSFASTFNRTSFDIDTTNFPYVKLVDIYNDKKEGGDDVVHPINGLYVHTSQLGDSPVIIDAKISALLICHNSQVALFVKFWLTNRRLTLSKLIR